MIHNTLQNAASASTILIFGSTPRWPPSKPQQSGSASNTHTQTCFHLTRGLHYLDLPAHRGHCAICAEGLMENISLRKRLWNSKVKPAQAAGRTTPSTSIIHPTVWKQLMFDQLDPNSSLCSSFVFLGVRAGYRHKRPEPVYETSFCFIGMWTKPWTGGTKLMKAPAGLLFSVLWLIPSPLSVGLFVSEGEGEEEKGRNEVQPGGNATQRDRWADRLDSCHRSRCQQVPSESCWSWQRERHRAAGDSPLQLLSHLILPTNPHQLTSQ